MKPNFLRIPHGNLPFKRSSLAELEVTGLRGQMIMSKVLFPISALFWKRVGRSEICFFYFEGNYHFWRKYHKNTSNIIAV